MFGASRNGKGRLSIGKMNIEAAQKTIGQAGLNVASIEVGGRGKKAVF